jgi:signal transduction histidine kinase
MAIQSLVAVALALRDDYPVRGLTLVSGYYFPTKRCGHSVHVGCCTGRNDEIPPSETSSTDLTVYRCIQESLTNSIRHAQAKQVDVEICDDHAAKVLKLIIRDDGRGMAADASAGLGISGMQERVEGLGGRYHLQSQIGRGTCVNVIIPLGDPKTAHRNDNEIMVETT